MNQKEDLKLLIKEWLDWLDSDGNMGKDNPSQYEDGLINRMKEAVK